MRCSRALLARRSTYSRCLSRERKSTARNRPSVEHRKEPYRNRDGSVADKRTRKRTIWIAIAILLRPTIDWRALSQRHRTARSRGWERATSVGRNAKPSQAPAWPHERNIGQLNGNPLVHTRPPPPRDRDRCELGCRDNCDSRVPSRSTNTRESRAVERAPSLHNVV